MIFLLSFRWLCGTKLIRVLQIGVLNELTQFTIRMQLRETLLSLLHTQIVRTMTHFLYGSKYSLQPTSFAFPFTNSVSYLQVSSHTFALPVDEARFILAAQILTLFTFYSLKNQFSSTVVHCNKEKMKEIKG